MGYVVDLDPTHCALRITVTTALTDEACKDIYWGVKRLASQGGPYKAVIVDLSQVVDYSVSSDTARALAATAPMVPGGGPRVIVAREPVVYGVSRMFEVYRELMGGQSVTILKSMDEAYDLLNATPQDFSQRLFPEDAEA